MQPIDIGPETVADEPAVAAVLRRAFDTQPEVADLVAAIRSSAGYEPSLALVARVDGAVVGFVMISHAALVDDAHTSHDVLTLSPLGVHPDHQKAGVGSALVRAVLAAAQARDDLPRLVVLEGSPGYYSRLGFETAARHGVTLHLPDGVPPEAAQVYRLDGYDPRVPGRVVYPAPFRIVADPLRRNRDRR